MVDGVVVLPGPLPRSYDFPKSGYVIKMKMMKQRAPMLVSTNTCYMEIEVVIIVYS
jgi:hypothetical protein